MGSANFEGRREKKKKLLLATNYATTDNMRHPKKKNTIMLSKTRWRRILAARTPCTCCPSSTHKCIQKQLFACIFLFSLIQNFFLVDLIIMKKLLWKDKKARWHKCFFFLLLKAFWLFHCAFYFLIIYICSNTKFPLNWPDNNKKIILKNTK